MHKQNLMHILCYHDQHILVNEKDFRADLNFYSDFANSYLNSPLSLTINAKLDIIFLYTMLCIQEL